MAVADFPKMIAHLGRKMAGKLPVADKVDLTGKKIIVTGGTANSVGYETARTLASWGATVIITTRSNADYAARVIKQDLAESGIKGLVEGYELELADSSSVKNFSEWYLTHHGDRLDALVNNAGVHFDLLSQWHEPVIEDGFEVHWRVNFLGVFQLTNLLLPVLKNTGVTHGEARVVNVTSHLHTHGLNSEFFNPVKPYNSWDAYAQSKLAVVHHAFQLQRNFGGEYNLKACAVHPGSVYSNIAHKGLDGNPLLQKIRNIFAPIEKMILLTAHQGAQSQLYCATNVDAVGGSYYVRCGIAQANPEVLDIQASERLWKQAMEWFDGLEQKAAA